MLDGLLAADGTTWMALLMSFGGPLSGLPHCALAVGRGTLETLDNYGDMVRSQSSL